MTEPFSIFEASRLVHLTYLMANEFLEKMNSLGCFSLGGIFFFFCGEDAAKKRMDRCILNLAVGVMDAECMCE